MLTAVLGQDDSEATELVLRDSFPCLQDQILYAERLTGGIENDVFHLETVQGAFILRLYRARSYRAAQQEAALLINLRGHLGAFETPFPQVTSDGLAVARIGRRVATLYRRIDGVAPTLAQAQSAIPSLVEALLSLHGVNHDRFGRQSYISAQHIHDLADKLLAMEILDAEDSRNLSQELANLTAYERLLEMTPLSVIHADVTLLNLLADSNGQVRSIIDFDDYCTGRSALDFALLARTLSFDKEFRFLAPVAAEIYQLSGVCKILSLPEFNMLIRFACFRMFITVSGGGSSDRRQSAEEDRMKWKSMHCQRIGNA